MMTLGLIIIVQFIVAGIVIFALKCLLDRELQKAAIEKFSSLKAVEALDTIQVLHAHPLSAGIKDQLIAITQHKYSQSKIVFEQKAALKGGLVIVVADQVYDFSLANRLENFWS